MHLSKKKKNFSWFFFAFFKSRLNFENFQKKKMTLIAYVFPKLQTAKYKVREVSKNYRFRRPFDKLTG